VSLGDPIRRSILRDAIGIGVATGAYGVSFGAISVTGGLSLLQTSALSLLMFTGASQFAMVSLIGGGGSPIAGAATAVLLGTRNAFYGLRLSRVIGGPGRRRGLGAQFVIDETTAMAVAADSDAAARLAFWATAVSVFTLWNLGTILGAVGAQSIPDPKTLGLDAAAPAAFLALLAPRMTRRHLWAVSLGAALVALASVPLVPAGVPVLLAAFVTVVAALRLEGRGKG
jgi:predicted branched-subunit amino acid permease